MFMARLAKFSGDLDRRTQFRFARDSIRVFDCHREVPVCDSIFLTLYA